MSRKSLRFLLPIGVGLILLSQFNNCDNFSSSIPIDTMQNSQCVGATCYSQLSEALELEINAGTIYGVAPSVQIFDLGGWCNEGGYPNNKVIWELSLTNFVVYSTRSLTTNSKCVNGRFTVRVDLGISRAGLKNPQNGNLPSSYNLDIEVIGLDSYGAEHRNLMNARKRIILNPIPQ